MAAEICFAEGATFGVPEIPNDRKKLREQLCKCAEKLDAVNYLRAIGGGVKDVQEVDTRGAHYFLLELNTTDRKLTITGYTLSARARATMDRAEVERTFFGSEEHDSVLVSAESMTDLRRAYINYFLDMHRFIEVVEHATA